MTDPAALQLYDDTFNEDLVATHLVGEKKSVRELKRTINAIADELYRPPWK